MALRTEKGGRDKWVPTQTDFEAGTKFIGSLSTRGDIKEVLRNPNRYTLYPITLLLPDPDNAPI